MAPRVGKKEEQFYLKLRKNITEWLNNNTNLNHRWREYLLVVPDIFHLLVKLVQDPDVPQAKKLKLVAAIAYFISPIDFLPEAFLGPVGYLDDLGLAAYVLNDLLNTIDPQIIKRNWVGDVDILYLVKKILINIDNIIGKGLWEKVRGKVK
jgi:uncharacterized membrane protein YkvA (DUF1232 family)